MLCYSDIRWYKFDCSSQAQFQFPQVLPLVKVANWNLFGMYQSHQNETSSTKCRTVPKQLKLWIVSLLLNPENRCLSIEYFQLTFITKKKIFFALRVHVATIFTWTVWCGCTACQKFVVAAVVYFTVQLWPIWTMIIDLFKV